MNHLRLISVERLVGLASLRKQRWLLILAVLAAVMGLGVLLGSILRAYGESHYDYLTSVPTSSAPTLSRAALT